MSDVYDAAVNISGAGAPVVLFLAADRDHLVPAVAQARFMCGCVAGSTLRVLTGHGHICLIAPDLDLEAILRQWRG